MPPQKSAVKPAPKPSPKPSPKREHLLGTAWHLFYRDGYHAVGIDTLLAEADVAKMTLYNHFASKDDLIAAVIKNRSDEVLAGLDGAVKAAGTSPDARLLAVFDWLRALFAESDFRGCAFVRAMGEFPERDHAIFQAAWHHKQTVRKLLVGLAAEAGAKDPAALADMFRLLIDGCLVAAHASGNPKPAIVARNAAAGLLKLAKA